jgi:hypothetical protein
MKILKIKDSGALYTSNVYLVLGEWNAIDDVNTLVDVGADPAIIPGIEEIYTEKGTQSELTKAKNQSAIRGGTNGCTVSVKTAQPIKS